MPDNLTIEIGADSSKLRADLSLAEAELKKLAAELKAAAKAGDEGQVRRLSAEYESVRAKVQKYRDGLKGLDAAHREAGGAVARLGGEVTRLSGPFAALHQAIAAAHQPLARLREGFGEFREPLGELHEGFSRIGESINAMIEKTMPRLKEIMALSVAAAGYEVAKVAGEAASGVRDTENYARAFGVGTGDYEALELTFAKAGIGSDRGVELMTRFSQAIGQARQALEKTNAAAVTFSDGVAILRGSVGQTAQGVETLRGGVQNLASQFQDGVETMRGSALLRPDLSSPLNTLKTAMGIDPARFSQDAAGQIRLLGEFADHFQRLSASQQAVVGEQFLGREWSQGVAALRNLGPELDHAREMIEKSGLGLEDVEKQQAASFNASEALFRFYIERVKSIIGNGLGQAFIPFFDGITAQLSAHGEQIRAWADRMGRRLAEVSRDIMRLFSGAQPATLKTDFAKDLAKFAAAAAEAARTLRAAFEAVEPVLDAVASGINTIFGTHLTAGSLAIVAAIGAMSGAFSFLAALISPGGLVVVGILGFLAVVGRLPEIIGAAAAKFKEWGDAIGGPVGRGLKAIGDDLQVVTDLLGGKFSQALQDWKAMWADALAAVSEAWSAFTGGIGGAIDRIMGLLQGLTDKARSIGSAISSLFGGGGGGGGSDSIDSGVVASAPIPPAESRAAGGLIRGPGSGTSDSVLARVSNGEYVLNAAATARIGAGTLDRLNRGFALGGLVTMPHALGHIADRVRGFAEGGIVALPALLPEPALPGFAGGGLVAGGGGSHVHLTIGDRIFHLRSDDDTATSLTRYARQREMTSAGRKPSWYGS